jgi:SNF2 family DNA or RNA helicase
LAESVLTQTFTPHDYQREAMDHIYRTPRCALWMPMGGGKTVTTLTALDNLDFIEDVFPVLVLAPLRVARSTWPDEVAKWQHLAHLRVSVITGSAKERAAALRNVADIYTMNYDNLVWLRETLGDEWPFKTVVADEFTRLKSFRLRQGGSRAAALGKVAHTRVSRFIGLTGTPAPNGVKDLWGQTWFLDQGARLGRTFSAFEQRWFRKGYDGYSLVPYAHTQREVEEALKDICLTVQALSVDEPNTLPIYIDLPKKARKAYDAMEEEMYAMLAEGEIEAANAAVRTQKCLQLANGAAYTDDEGSWEEVHDAKLDALESIIEEANGAPVLVAYNFKHDLARLQARFRKGRVLDADPDTIRQWNAGRIQLLFAHPASAGHGLNLADGGNILAFFGVNWNLEEHMQIIERIGPMRQKQAGYDRPVMVYPILARDTIDDVVMDRLGGKKSVQEALLEAMKSRRQK